MLFTTAVLLSRPASADPGMHTLRAEAGAATFVAAPQNDSFSLGGGFGASYELRPIDALGIEVRYSVFFFPRADSERGPSGDAQAPAVGLRLHPLPGLHLGDLWLGAAGAVAITGNAVRVGLEAGVGFELELAWPVRVGPFVRFHHILQPDDDALGPSDASFVSFGIAGAFLGRRPASAVVPQLADSDRDRDGAIDERDQCPDVAEDGDSFEDEDGCPDPDNDHDGVLDATDRCPNVAEDRDHFQDEDGCPDPDNDGDRVVDGSDSCPLEAEDRDGWHDEDGCPDPDDDSDGIADASDACPREPETQNGYQDQDGCPDAVEREIAEVSEQVFFRTNRARIRGAAGPALERVVEILNQHPEITLVRIDGHADERGTAEFNLDLSHRRAVEVQSFLVAHGIDAARLQVAAHGAAARQSAGTSQEQLARNRRVQFTVMAIGGNVVRAP